MAPPIRVALIDDYEVVLRGVARMFEPYSDRVEVVELDANKAPSTGIDVALYDTFAQPQSNVDEVEDIIHHRRFQKVAFYTWNLDDQLIDAALARGVRGYLGKNLTASELVDAIERVHRGETVITRPTEGRQVMVGGDWPGRGEGLTTRESEILALITQGYSNQEVADRAYLSINSVKSYIRSAYRKMGVSSRSQAVVWGMQHGFSPDHKRFH